ncbi:MAG: TRAP transporter large permease subunit [Candidatus Rokubacteria bacterium]|nr:TRAP transporter large permease subunit [Candidatus Rokubacteria bacterium]
MLAAFLLGLHVAGALGMLSFSLMYVFSDRPLWEMLGLISWNTNTSFVLVAIPFFILMGEILLRSGLSERLYRVLSHWLSPLPGGLMHSNIAACATFAAMSGSSVATAATIGSVALPAFRAHGYNERLVLGSLAAGGTLGILIPPSINFIVYGVLMEDSIGRLYIAGVFPGILLSLLFMSVIFFAAILSPGVAPRETGVSWKTRLLGLIDMLPTFVLIFLVLGTIYLGVATPTEAAAFGVSGAFVLAVLVRKVNLAMLREVFLSSARTTAMVMLILTAAFILNSTLAILGVPYAISRAVASWGLTPITTLVILVVFYLVLGTFMDGFAMMVTTIPVILPVLKTMNIDLIWFGVIAVILTEAALISPPEGLNLYVIHGLRQRVGEAESKRTIMDVYMGVLPFFLVMLLGIALIMAFPQIALWLPTTMKGS